LSAAIELDEVFRVYSGVEGAAALQGLTLTVADGELLVVLGPSGSGKTTLLRLLAGLDRPSAGRVRVHGRELARLSPRELAGYRSQFVGYADQRYSRALAAELSARELVAVPLGLRGATRRERHARADELLERVGLADRRTARPGELSGGERQRVALCAALSHRPRILLADEPTAELDHEAAATVYALVRELARSEACTTVLVSHDEESGAIADRIVALRDGRVSEQLNGGAEASIVVGRGGWLRLPEELLRHGGIEGRALARVERGRIVVVADRPGREEAPAVTALPRRTPAVVVAEIRSLGRSFGGRDVLTGVDASFAIGRLAVVTGPSGSGKTTLLHLLAGLDLPSTGEVVVRGTVLSSLDRVARNGVRRDHIALVPQDPELAPFLTARENVELALAVRGRSNDGALDALQVVGLATRATHRVDRLSTGERARVAIARALAPRPSLLLLDEPTSRLDRAGAEATAVLIARAARDAGAAVVCATHDTAVIDQADARVDLAQVPSTSYHQGRTTCVSAS
jgi:ABC-type lipoprotein export system ATPase subunit